jgi:hypothetical protein
MDLIEQIVLNMWRCPPRIATNVLYDNIWPFDNKGYVAMEPTCSMFVEILNKWCFHCIWNNVIPNTR